MNLQKYGGRVCVLDSFGSGQGLTAQTFVNSGMNHTTHRIAYSAECLLAAQEAIYSMMLVHRLKYILSFGGEKHVNLFRPH
jgi:hypothetical protein